MNKIFQYVAFSIALLAGLSLATGAHAQRNKASAGEQFFIISSVDQPKSQLLLKRPTEVTVLMKVNDKTRYLDENGKAIHVSDLRAGDTVWLTSSGGAEPVATSIRRGPMTIAELHRSYLDYPEIK